MPFGKPPAETPSEIRDDPFLLILPPDIQRCKVVQNPSLEAMAHHLVWGNGF